MQAEETELLTPNVLETPSSLMTPDIVFNASTTTATTTIITTTYDPLHNQADSVSMSNSSTKTNETSSADIKLSKIEDELKQSLAEPRKPTPSPFQKISTNGVFILENRTNPVVTVDDGSTIEIPSTADVVKELEAMTNTSTNPFEMKNLMTERETTMNGDNNRLDPFQNSTKAANVSPPKKSFLFRSQSHTEPTSPQPNSNQSQKINENNTNTFDDDNLIESQFTRTSDLPAIAQTNDFKAILDNGNEHIIKQQQQQQQQHQQQVIVNNKRPFPANVPPMTKAATLIIPPSTNNEVTSTFPLSKRTRTAHGTPANTTVMNFHPVPTTTTTTSTIQSMNNNGSNAGSDDQRKKQIRDSNREAARRCRERRRQYIEQLEGNLEHHKLQIKQLQDKLTRLERENTQLHAILSESKILHTTRLNMNDSHLDYGNVLNATAIEINSDSTDGPTLQRNYINRNNL